MKVTNILSAGALALTLSLSGLAATACATSMGAGHATEKGSLAQCGSGSCGSDESKPAKPDEAPADDGTEKGAPAACGEGSCG